MVNASPGLLVAIGKSAVAHTVTYFVIGVLSFVLFEYDAVFGDPAIAPYFRSADDPLVMAGPLFQPIRGVLLGGLVFLLYSVLLVHWVHHPEKRWLSWGLCVAFALMLFFPALGFLVPRPS